MLRGINRSIIEINETENKYFERVLIFVRPEFGCLPASQLEREASRLVGKMGGAPVGLHKRYSARQMALKRRRRFITACAVGVGLIALLAFGYLIR